MGSRDASLRDGILFFKYFAVIIGSIAAFIALVFVVNEYSYLATVSFGFGDIILISALVAIILSSVALVASLPSSMRVRFQRPR
ncbi:MAG TPA: hypothetical protein VN739_01010, partial [Nitrososphaerales archaeon]|nr:hypothetical protein [Nitrososphaerales archaeon]